MFFPQFLLKSENLHTVLNKYSIFVSIKDMTCHLEICILSFSGNIVQKEPVELPAILLSKMPFLGIVFVWDKNFFSKSCKLFLNAHFLEKKFSKKLPLGLCRLVLSRL